MAHETHSSSPAAAPQLGHVSSIPQLVAVAAALLFLTFITVYVSLFDFGRLNLIVAMAIAVLKGSLVVLYFMHMRYETPFNAIAFVTSLAFLALFIVFAMIDSDEYKPNVIPGYAPTIEQLEP